MLVKLLEWFIFIPVMKLFSKMEIACR